MLKKLLNNENGFTIFEVLVVMIIVGILIAVAVPTYTTTIRNMKMNTALTQIVSDLRQMQARSMAKGQQHGIKFTNESNTYETITDGYTANTIEVMNLPEGMSVMYALFPSNTIYFERSGAPNQGGMIKLKHESSYYMRYISVAGTTGRIKIE